MTGREALPRRWRLLPPDTTRDAAVLLETRALRAFGDGFISVLMPLYLTRLGFDAARIGAVTTAPLLGSAALTMLVGLVSYRFPRRRLLLSAALLMSATGVAFASVRGFWPLIVVAAVGTLNPSSGDVSVFLPLEQALLPQTVSDRERTALFAHYSLVGTLVAAVGALKGAYDLVLLAKFAAVRAPEELEWQAHARRPVTWPRRKPRDDVTNGRLTKP